MTKSKVFFTDMRVNSAADSLPAKLGRLVKAAGIENIDFKDKFVAIKIHFGEPGNLAFLRHQYAAVLVDIIKKLGGKPFLTDCNTLYVGGRKNGLDHLDAAYKNGFTPFATGCHVVIADGIKGTDEAHIPVEGGEYVKDAKIGRALADADIIISLNHFKGHEMAGFGGCLKNIGMGGGSRAGKCEMHSNGKPKVNQDKCVGCGICKRNCANNAITITNKKASINHDNCLGCGSCVGACIRDAITPSFDEAMDIMNKKIAEYTKAIIDGKPNFHVNIAVDVSPYCDCYGGNDLAVVPNVGMFASFDPIAIDVASVDMVNKMPAIPGSILDEKIKKHEDHHDHFCTISPNTNWKAGIEHGIRLGLGTSEYELVNVK